MSFGASCISVIGTFLEFRSHFVDLGFFLMVHCPRTPLHKLDSLTEHGWHIPVLTTLEVTFYLHMSRFASYTLLLVRRSLSLRSLEVSVVLVLRNKALWRCSQTTVEMLLCFLRWCSSCDGCTSSCDSHGDHSTSDSGHCRGISVWGRSYALK